MLSGRPAGGSLTGGPEADGGDSPAWSRKRDRYGPAAAGRARRARCPTPSCTATPTSASSTARASPRSWSRRPRGSGWRRWRSPTTTACTAWSGSPRRRAELGVATVFGAELSLGLSAPQNGVADPEGTHLLVLARDPEGYRAALPRDQRRPAARRGEGPPGLRPRRAGRRTRRATCWSLTGCRKGAVRQALRRAAATPRGASCASWSSGSAGDNVAVELTHAGLPADTERNDALAELAADARPADDRHHRAHYATPGAAPAGHGAGRGARPAQPRRADGWLPAGGHRAPALRRGAWPRRFAPLPRRGGSAPRARRASARFDLRWWPRTCRRSRCRRGTTEMTLAARAHLRGVRRGATAADAETPRPTQQIDHELEIIEELELPRLLPDRPGHRRVLPPAPTSSARAAARPPTPRSATRWASPTSTPWRWACCSSGSCPRRATARRTSTSTSSPAGARR